MPRACTPTAPWHPPRSYGASRSARQPVPAAETHAVVESVLAVDPELDGLRNEPVAAPEGRKRNVDAVESSLDLCDELIELDATCESP